MAPVEVLARIAAGARVDEVGAGTVIIEDIGFAAAEIVAIALGQFALLEGVQRDAEAAPVELPAIGSAQTVLLRSAVPGTEMKPSIVPPSSWRVMMFTTPATASEP